MKDKDYHYNIIDNALKSYEENKVYHRFTISWITDRIDWCWKFRKITEDQLEELTNRVINVLKK